MQESVCRVDVRVLGRGAGRELWIVSVGLEILVVNLYQHSWDRCA